MREPTAPAYHDRRAPEYDDWYLGRGGFGELERPGFADELDVVVATLAELAQARTLDVACGTGFLMHHLRDAVTALDRSPRLLAIARERLPAATIVEGDALALPFDADSFDRLVTCHVYGHLDTRYFTPDALAGELGGGDVLLAGTWFVSVRSRR